MTMRPIDNDTLTKLRAKLAESREAEYRCVIEVANASMTIVDAKLDDLRDAQLVTAGIERVIDLARLVANEKTGNAEADIYTQGAPMPPETLGDW